MTLECMHVRICYCPMEHTVTIESEHGSMHAWSLSAIVPCCARMFYSDTSVVRGAIRDKQTHRFDNFAQSPTQRSAHCRCVHSDCLGDAPKRIDLTTDVRHVASALQMLVQT